MHAAADSNKAGRASLCSNHWHACTSNATASSGYDNPPVVLNLHILDCAKNAHGAGLAHCSVP